MPIKGVGGTISHISIRGKGYGYGPQDDHIDVQAVIKLKNTEGGFGIKLKPNDVELPTNLAMLSTLRDAYYRNHVVILRVEHETGKKNGYIQTVTIE